MKIVILLSLFAITSIFGQIRLTETGALAGAGYISGRSPAVFSFGSGFYVRFDDDNTGDIVYEFAALYAQDADRFLPEDRRGRYYPFVRGVQGGMVIERQITGVLSMTGSGSVLLMNDRTFSDVNEWGWGLSISGGGRLYIESTNVVLSASMAYAITMQATSPGYRLFFISAGYRF